MTDTDVFPPAPAVERLSRAIAVMRRARTSSDVLAAIPRAVIELGFERVMFSAVDEECWRPRAVRIAGDSSWSERVQDAAITMPQPLASPTPETRVIQRASPVIVPPPRDVHVWSKKTWDYRHPPKTTAYVASPIVTDGRVVGMIHADRGSSCGPLSGRHAALLWSFSGVVELALEAAAAEERLGRMRGHLDDMLALSSGAVLPADRDRRSAPQPTTPSSFLGDAGLTERERHILELLSRGLSNAQIAEQLVLAEGTVKAHVKHVLAKTQSPNRTAAALKWTRGDVA